MAKFPFPPVGPGFGQRVAFQNPQRSPDRLGFNNGQGAPLPGSEGSSPAPGGCFKTTKISEVARAARVQNLVTRVNGPDQLLTPFLLQATALRNLLGFRNTSAAANAYIDFGQQASTDSFLKIPPTGIILFDQVVPQDDLYIFFDAFPGSLTTAVSTYSPDFE